MTKKLKHILIIQTAFIGDVILATALIENLALNTPGIKIDILVRKGNESLLSNNPHINRVLIWNKKQNKYRNLLAAISSIRKAKYDAVINLQRFAATGLITAFSKANMKIGFKENPFSGFYNNAISHDIKSGIHEVERNQQLIHDFSGKDASKPQLYPTAEDYKSVKKYKSGKYICIAPTSVWFTKQFPAHKWIEFIATVPNEVTIYLLGGPDDFKACDEIVKTVEDKQVINLAGKLSFLKSAALMKNAVMNYVNDSAPMHIASSVNAPVTAVYCSTVPKFGFGPLSDNSTIVETPLNLDCRPCGLHGKNACPKDDFECAESIVLKFGN
jgi:heptosyltransferase-2